MKHLSIRQLWVQDSLREGAFTLSKIRTEENWADCLTKPLARAKFVEMAVQLGMYDDEAEADMCTILGRVPDAPLCPRCAVEMLLDVNVAGRCLWRCSTCGDVMTWEVFSASASDVGERVPTTVIYAESVHMGDVKKTTRKTTTTSTTGTSSASSSTTPPAKAKASATTARTGTRVSQGMEVTAKQWNYLEMLCLKLGRNFADLVGTIHTRAQASAVIDQLKKELEEQ